jgi:hypothetical protein
LILSFFLFSVFDFTSFDFQCLWNLKVTIAGGVKKSRTYTPGAGRLSGCLQQSNPKPNYKIQHRQCFNLDAAVPRQECRQRHPVFVFAGVLKTHRQ